MKLAKKSNKELNQHDIHIQLIHHLAGMSGSSLKHLANQAGVHWTTLYNWQTITQNPRIDTLAKVATCLNYEIRLVRVRSTPRLTRVK